MRVAIVGATGFIGRRLTRALAERGDEVVALSRRGRDVPGARAVAWDPGTSPLPRDALEAVDAVVNLAGEPLTKRWTEARKRAIVESRVQSTRGVVEALGDGGPSVLVNASGVDFYGSRGEEVLTEASRAGSGFLADVVLRWEGAAREAEGQGVRVVLVRSGVVLAADGGALPKLVLPTKLFVGGPIGGGQQWFPWIQVDDEVGLFQWALDNDAVRGPIVAVAPNPVRQKDFAAALGRVLGRPAFLPTPGFVLTPVLGEGAQVVLSSKRVLPRAALDSGYRFKFPELEPALRAALGR